MSTANPSKRYSTPIHRRLLTGFLLAAVVTTLLEALHLSSSLGDSIRPRTWYLATLYAAAPLVVLMGETSVMTHCGQGGSRTNMHAGAGHDWERSKGTAGQRRVMREE